MSKSQEAIVPEGMKRMVNKAKQEVLADQHTESELRKSGFYDPLTDDGPEKSNVVSATLKTEGDSTTINLKQSGKVTEPATPPALTAEQKAAVKEAEEKAEEAKKLALEAADRDAVTAKEQAEKDAAQAAANAEAEARNPGALARVAGTPVLTGQVITAPEEPPAPAPAVSNPPTARAIATRPQTKAPRKAELR